MNTMWPTNSQVGKRLDLAAQNPAHAYIFSGQKGYGARVLADVFAAKLLGLEYVSSTAPLQHSNIVYIAPQEGKKKISISQIHSLIHNASQTKFSQNLPRIFIIDRAEQLSLEASTALLKTLEEPSLGTIFILTTYSLHSILPTIRSRAVTITLPKLSNAEMQQYLSNNSAISEQDSIDQFKNSSEEARQFATGTVSEKLAVAKQVAEKQEASDFLDRLCYTLPTESSILVRAFNQERIMEAEKQIGSNVNQRFVLENLALQWSN